MSQTGATQRIPNEKTMEVLKVSLASLSSQVDRLSHTIESLVKDLDCRVKTIELYVVEERTMRLTLAETIAELKRYNDKQDKKIEDQENRFNDRFDEQDKKISDLDKSINKILPWIKLLAVVGGLALTVASGILVALATGAIKIVPGGYP